jgi:cytochrome c-type biogenesis protein CcmH
VRRLAAVLAAVAALGSPAAAVAADCPRTTLGDVEDEVMCPVCGTPLELATESPQAQRERQFIQRLVDRCRSKEQIKRALVAEFGDDVLATPRGGGFDLAAYLVPGLAILLAAGGIAAAAWRWRGRREPRRASPGGGAASERVDADLERYDL